jgi:hypothetical protein
VYDEIEVKLKDAINEKEYISGNQFRWFNNQVRINLKLRNLPKDNFMSKKVRDLLFEKCNGRCCILW